MPAVIWTSRELILRSIRRQRALRRRVASPQEKRIVEKNISRLRRELADFDRFGMQPPEKKERPISPDRLLMRKLILGFVKCYRRLTGRQITFAVRVIARRLPAEALARERATLLDEGLIGKRGNVWVWKEADIAPLREGVQGRQEEESQKNG